MLMDSYKSDAGLRFDVQFNGFIWYRSFPLLFIFFSASLCCVLAMLRHMVSITDHLILYCNLVVAFAFFNCFPYVFSSRNVELSVLSQIIVVIILISHAIRYTYIIVNFLSIQVRTHIYFYGKKERSGVKEKCLQTFGG